MNYAGNKARSNLLHEIINKIPPHNRYYELFLGSGGIARYIYPCPTMIGIEKVKSIAEQFKNDYPKQLKVKVGCGIKFLEKNRQNFTPEDFIFLDPPYPRYSRRGTKNLYRNELTDEDHRRILEAIINTKAQVMICTYENALYSLYLDHWHKIDIPVTHHAGHAIERIYFNYTPPVVLHDYRYLGKDNTDRQRIKRMQIRILKRINRLPELEKAALLQHIQNNFFELPAV